MFDFVLTRAMQQLLLDIKSRVHTTHTAYGYGIRIQYEYVYDSRYRCTYEFLAKQLRVVCLERMRMDLVVQYAGEHSLGGVQVRVRVGENEQLHASAGIRRRRVARQMFERALQQMYGTLGLLLDMAELRVAELLVAHPAHMQRVRVGQ